MSYNTLHTQIRDDAFGNRVNAAVQQQARQNPAFVDTAMAELVRSTVLGAGNYFVWDVAVATEAAYASALLNQIPDPGAREDVITDGMILAAVQAAWPPDEAVEAMP